MELQPGTYVTPNVRLVELLGRGGMGSVWIADHTSLATRVAVKFVSAELVKQESTILERFNREASLSAQIKSPYVVQTFDHGVMDDGRPYIVMELLEGASLAEVLDRRDLDLEETRLVVSQAAKALSKAHKIGIVHRDIKPDNLFLTYEDDELFLKVLDFGIAKQTGLPKASQVTGTGVMVGTPEYMSPEQVLSAKSVDARSDLWALAVVAYHCLTGSVPFCGETLGSLCVAIANGQFTPPSHVRPELPPTIDAWFLKGLAIKPEDRFATAKELARSFAAALHGKGITPRPSDAGSSVDWSGPHAAITGSHPSLPVQSHSRTAPLQTMPTPADPSPTMPSPYGAQTPPGSPSGSGAREPLASDASALMLAQSAQASPRARPQSVPTFAGTTLDPDRPKRRTVAALGLAALLCTLAVGGFFLLNRDGETLREPASESFPEAEVPPPPAAPAPAPTPEVSAATGEPESSSDVAPTPSVEASSKDPQHVKAQPRPPQRAKPRPVRPAPPPVRPPPKPQPSDHGF